MEREVQWGSQSSVSTLLFAPSSPPAGNPLQAYPRLSWQRNKAMPHKGLLEGESEADSPWDRCSVWARGTCRVGGKPEPTLLPGTPW